MRELTRRLARAGRDRAATVRPGQQPEPAAEGTAGDRGRAVRAPRAALPTPLRRPLAVLAAVCGVLVVAQAVLYAGTSAPGTADAAVTAWVQEQVPMSYPVAFAIDAVGMPWVASGLAAVVALACLLTGRRRGALLACLGPALAVAVTSALKPLMDRTIHGDNLAFPSGHTAVATAIGATAFIALAGATRLRPATALAVAVGGTVVCGAVMAVSQVFLTAHYPSDTLGGFAIAVCAVVVTGWGVDLVADALRRRRQR
ncbi:membrane protein [Pseudonocardia sp. D17]|nr:membrane protein [Pseudonocardia sp. D17]